MAEDSKNEALLREIPASEILDKIQKGEPAEYDHVRITGELDLSKLDLPMEHVARTEYQIKSLELPQESRVVYSPIKITVLSNFLIILYYCPINLNYKFLIKN